jgi:predicted transcriptional regulator
LGSELQVADVLRWCRLRRGVSARRLSLNAGVSESVAGKLESGAIEPSLRVFAAITHELSLNDREVAWLVALAYRSGVNGEREP